MKRTILPIVAFLATVALLFIGGVYEWVGSLFRALAELIWR